MKNKIKIFSCNFQKVYRANGLVNFLKVSIFFGLLIFLAIPKVFSQGIMYGYDENGNRTLRDVIVLTQEEKTTTIPDSTNNANDTTLAQTNSVDSPEASKQNRIEASFAGNKVLIYPNPAKYYITVETENISAQNTEINVCDIYGKSIETIHIYENLTKIDFSQKANGTYLLKMTINNKSKTWTIVKE